MAWYIIDDCIFCRSPKASQKSLILCFVVGGSKVESEGVFDLDSVRGRSKRSMLCLLGSSLSVHGLAGLGTIGGVSSEMKSTMA
ncbi:unnamed protein product [Prunus brigantina]